MRFWRTFGFVATMVLATSGCSLYGWGQNHAGQLGDGTTTYRADPVAAAPDLDFIKVEVAFYHSCGIDRDHALYCWGNNAQGELGLGTSGDDGRNVPTRVGTATGWTDVAAAGNSSSQSYTCGVRSGSLFCWGWNQDGQLGLGDTTSRSTPTRVGTDSDWTHVTGGHGFACGTRAGGTLFCWGTGYIGDGTLGTHLAPVEIASTSKWKLVVAGGSHTCGIRGDGLLFCWGDNYVGQIGDPVMGQNGFRTVPRRVGQETGWTHLALGTSHTCAIRGGALYCWGSNFSGELGNGTTSPTVGNPRPTQVGTATDWTGIAAGEGDSCGIRSPGNLFCWGNTPVAGGGATTRTLPVQEPLDHWTSISIGILDRLGLRYP